MLDELRAKQAKQDARLSTWRDKLGATVAGGLDDARGRARQAITTAMRERTQGRRTLAALSNHPEIKAAVARIDELAAQIVDGVADARADFARQALSLWAAGPWLASVGPSGKSRAKLVALARGVAVLGETLGAYVAADADKAKRSLLIAAEAAANPGDSRRDGLDALDDWQAATARAWTSRTAGQLRGSLTLIDKLAARSLIPNALLESDPYDELGPKAG